MTKKKWASIVLFSAMFFLSGTAFPAEPPSLSPEQSAAAAANYQQYCSLCHGEKREGYVNDHAPSLRSKSLMTSGAREGLYATAYGRLGTPMAGYLDEIGGPMTLDEIRSLTSWLQNQVETEAYAFTFDAIAGDTEVGEQVYAKDCASCHGENGEGGVGTALGNSCLSSTFPSATT